MPVIQISSSGPMIPVQPVAAVTSRSPLQPAATLRPDSVKLSLAAQVKLMRHQGVSPGVIASQLGISAKQMASYIPAASATATGSPASLSGSPSSTVDSDDAGSQIGRTATSTDSGTKALSSGSPATENRALPQQATTATGSGSAPVAAVTVLPAGLTLKSE